jgi:hypothetical protein
MPEDHITARSITVVDAAGQPRIVLDGGGTDGFATITLVSTTREHIQLAAQPDGAVSLALGGPALHGRVIISDCGFDLRGRDGKFGVTIGDFFRDGRDRITVHRDGQPIWSMPTTDATPKA